MTEEEKEELDKKEQELIELRKTLTDLARESKTLDGLEKSADPSVLTGLKTDNGELKQAIEKREKELMLLILEMKNPSDESSLKARLETLKTALIAFCKEKEVDKNLWKKFESW